MVTAGHPIPRPPAPASTREQLADPLVAHRLVGAELLGGQRHPELLEQPPRPAQSVARRAAGRQRRHLVGERVLERSHLLHPLPVTEQVIGQPLAAPSHRPPRRRGRPPPPPPAARAAPPPPPPPPPRKTPPPPPPPHLLTHVLEGRQ